MKENITDQLRAFWDAGIRGPDFVWAATGPAMEAYSKYPLVKKANEPGEVMSVAEFLRHVRREVVDFAVGRVLSQNGHAESTTGLDDVTAYYLLHRNDFRLDKAPMGACILYALSCGLSDSELTGRLDLLVQEKDEARLKSWKARKGSKLGIEAPGGIVPLIDQIHRLMHLWKAGDVQKVNAYLDDHGLRKSTVFAQVPQALIELSENDERATLESISNHVKAQGARFESGQLEAFGS